MEFEGAIDPSDAEEWLKAVERVLNAMGVTDAQKVTLATFSMKGDARDWWESFERQWTAPLPGVILAVPRVVTWERFVKGLTTYEQKDYAQLVEMARRVGKDIQDYNDNRESYKKNKTKGAAFGKSGGGNSKGGGQKSQVTKTQDLGKSQGGSTGWWKGKSGQETDRQTVNGATTMSCQCFSCGSTDHLKRDCPSALKSVKCYTCVTNNFDEELVIGSGGFGKVYKALIDDGAAATVALKHLNLKSKQGAKEFWTEIEMLSKLRHTHLISLLGYCNEHNEMILMENGTLADHLYKFKTNGNGINGHMSWEQRLNIYIGAARGLDYLHIGIRHSIIHRDVKTTNILLDKDWIAKISNFGLCKLVSASHSRTHVSNGSFGYFDPACFLTRRLTKKSDVYAFGVVLLGMPCGKPAVDTRVDEEPRSLVLWAKQVIKKNKLDQLIDPSLRDQISPHCLKVLQKLQINA
ncbi:hypothetical protein RHSIM_Rhsim10G0121700 [Rhododendron simsii]|uniref:non-specific serine/threonine protein kinase n=1 Tax=Rhododendron simsii TaxID=118357 RepID=A0A834GAU2_RHOSS|nr:hypothetical protein RHSIM_Rhsim10G0121700 [Rhododendron simsii]